MPVSEIIINETTTLKTTDMTDLEKYVLDDKIAPDSQKFEDFVAVKNPLEGFGSVVGPSTSGSAISGTAISGSGNQVQPLPVKRGRGRPRKEKPDPDEPK